MEREDSVAINCITGDSLLDFVAGRKAFMDALDSARPNAEWWQRREQAFAVIEVTNQPGKLEVIWLPDPAAEPCDMHITMLTPASIPGRKVRAYVHIHPFEAFTTATCIDSANNILSGNAQPGLSDSDSVTMHDFNRYITDSLTGTGWAPVPFYAMDPRWIYRQPPGQPLIDFANDMNKALNWTAGGRCKWVRPTLSQVPVSQVLQIGFGRQLPAISPRE